MRTPELFVPSLVRVLVALACATANLRAQVLHAPLQITIADLSADPAKFDGQPVRVRALLVYGWEGDDFLSDPTPQTSHPSRLWMYWKPEHEKNVADPFTADRASVEAWFTGCFHFVPDHHPNAMFDAGPLQLEVQEVSDAKLSQSLSAVILRGDLESARKTIRAGTKLNSWDEFSLFPLWHASTLGDADLVQDLLTTGADPNFAGPGGSTALQAAAGNCRVVVAKLLLSHGAASNAADVNGETPLMFSSQTCPDGEMVQVLLDSKADPNAKDTIGDTALLAAARNPVVAEKLLKAGADPATKNKYGNTVEGDSCDRGAEGFYRVCQLVRAAMGKSACEPGHCN